MSSNRFIWARTRAFQRGTLKSLDHARYDELGTAVPKTKIVKLVPEKDPKLRRCVYWMSASPNDTTELRFSDTDEKVRLT